MQHLNDTQHSFYAQLKLPSNAIRLVGEVVQLEPLTSAHAGDLLESTRDPELWHYLPGVRPDCVEQMQAWIETALHARRSGKEFPFAIRHLADGRLVGSTRFLDIQSENRSLEIGWTWVMSSYQRSAVNTEAKFMLLQYAFEELNAIRVQFKADARNEKSLRAIERLGAVKEGVLRSHRILADGVLRDSAYFSIIKAEWPAVRERLQGLLGTMRHQSLPPAKSFQSEIESEIDVPLD